MPDDTPNIDEQGRPDLLNQERALELARTLITAGPDIEVIAAVLLDVQAQALRIGRMEVGVGKPK